jgi:hypothetical protein
MECSYAWGEQVFDFSASERINVIPGCFGYAYINKGDTLVRVNDVALKGYPPGRPDLSGEAYSFVDSNAQPIFIQKFVINFAAAPGADLWLQLIQYYRSSK